MNRKPTVLHIVGSLEGGGAERWVRELVPQLNARGVSCEIVTIYPPRLSTSELEQLGCRVHHRQKHAGFDVGHFIWLYRLILKLKPNVVHTHQWTGKYVGRSAAILARTPLVLHTEHSPLPVSRRERWMAYVLSFKTDAVISFNDHKARLIRARERVAKFEIIRNGIPIPPIPLPEERALARRKLGVDQTTVVYGVVASLQERKNPLLALQAFARLQGDSQQVTRLDFFGDGPLRPVLEAQAHELGVSEHVRFHGFRSDVREYIPGLDVFVTLATQEMAPISMLEAMAAKLPIIGAPHAGTVEMVTDGVNGAIVEWNVESVVAAMRIARDDENWRTRCGSAGRALVERDYNIHRIADEHVALYRKLTGRRADRKHAALPLIAQL